MAWKVEIYKTGVFIDLLHIKNDHKYTEWKVLATILDDPGNLHTTQMTALYLPKGFKMITWTGKVDISHNSEACGTWIEMETQFLPLRDAVPSSGNGPPASNSFCGKW